MLDTIFIAAAFHAAPVTTPPTNLYARPAVENPPRLLAVAQVDPFARDGSGLDEPCGPVTQDRFGGWGSAIEWSGTGDRYYVLPDRGPKDGAEDYRCRVIEVELKVIDESTQRATLTAVSTTLLRNGKYQLVGLTNLYDAVDPSEGLRFDPEGLRLGWTGEFVISDEYGPLIAVFGTDGQRRRVLPVPTKFTIARPAARGMDEDRLNLRGRASNNGFEGLALSPDKRFVYALLQGPLLQDKGREGVNTRLLRLDTQTNTTAEFVYSMDSVHHGLHELLHVEAERFLVIERDGRSGAKAQHKRIVLIDLAGATDVSPVDALPFRELPPSITPITKLDVLDLLDDRYGLAGSSFPEKIEGLAFGPTRPDNTRTLVVTSDNDFKDEDPSWAWLFAMPPESLRMK